jgi:hypothetical protein
MPPLPVFTVLVDDMPSASNVGSYTIATCYEQLGYPKSHLTNRDYPDRGQWRSHLEADSYRPESDVLGTINVVNVYNCQNVCLAC